MPLMGNFFDRLEEVACPNLHCFMREWFGNPRTANVEEVLLSIEQLQDAPVAAERCRETFGPSFAANARAELSQYILRRLSHESFDPRHWAVQFLQLADANTTTVTTNYDRIAELLLSNRPGMVHLGNGQAAPSCPHCKLRSLLMWQCQCSGDQPVPPVHWRGAVLKLHGSVTWHTCRGNGCQQQYCLIPDPGCRPFQMLACNCCHGPTEPVLVLPSMTKTYKAYPHLQRMWDASLSALEEASRLVVFGFSFPASDAAICRLFRKSIEHSPHLRELVVVDAAPGPVADRVRRLLPEGRDLELHTFVVPTDGSTPLWWKGAFPSRRSASCPVKPSPSSAGTAAIAR
ncbi:MAG TPA: hypothetical protein PKE29_02605 [Phycisphaerales bacterium]|nr:hypothetical protein [Phycisphaerales bacterium]